MPKRKAFNLDVNWGPGDPHFAAPGPWAEADPAARRRALLPLQRLNTAALRRAYHRDQAFSISPGQA